MEVSFDFINGMCFGIEYISADEEGGIPYSCIIVDFACFRWLLEFTND